MNLEEKLEETMFGRKKYTTQTESIDPSKRDFLKTAGKGALAAGLIATGFLKTETAHAFDLANLPPGFQIVKDDALIHAYISMLSTGLYDRGRIKDILTRYGGWVQDVLKKETPLTEPAYWFTVNYYNYKYQTNGIYGMIGHSVEDMASKFNLSPNSSMYNWANGINMYFRTWVSKNYGSPLETETYLLRAIFTAAGRSESEVENYKTFDLTNKERCLQGVMNDLSKQNHTNQLIAAWSSFFYLCIMKVN